MTVDDLAHDIEEMLSHLYDASIQASMGGLGGCKHYEEHFFPAKYQRYITNYINQERNSSQCVMDYLFDNHYLLPEIHL
jgi:hypothetical protein